MLSFVLTQMNLYVPASCQKQLPPHGNLKANCFTNRLHYGNSCQSQARKTDNLGLHHGEDLHHLWPTGKMHSLSAQVIANY